MTKNMGSLDRALRLFVALLIGALVVTDRLGGVLAVVLGIVAVVLAVTSLSGWCPLYVPLHLSTRKDHPSAAKV